MCIISLTAFRRDLLILLMVGMTLLSGCGADDSPTAPAKRPLLVYVAMGASDAVGIGAFPLDKGYVYQIRDGLAAEAEVVELTNLGVSGERIGYLESTELPTALARRPAVVTIWAGPNDLIHGVDAATFETRLRNIFARLRQESAAVVVMANVPDLTLLPRFQLFPDDDVTAERVIAYNQAIAHQTAAFRIPLVDLYADRYAANWEYVSIDGFHPSNAGHAKIAELYLTILRPLLRETACMFCPPPF